MFDGRPGRTKHTHNPVTSLFCSPHGFDLESGRPAVGCCGSRAGGEISRSARWKLVTSMSPAWFQSLWLAQGEVLGKRLQAKRGLRGLALRVLFECGPFEDATARQGQEGHNKPQTKASPHPVQNGNPGPTTCSNVFESPKTSNKLLVCLLSDTQVVQTDLAQLWRHPLQPRSYPPTCADETSFRLPLVTEGLPQETAEVQWGAMTSIISFSQENKRTEQHLGELQYLTNLK